MSKKQKKNKKQKKKKPEEKKEFDLFQSRSAALMSLKSQCINIEETNKRLLKKIDEEGIEGYYSINSDLLRYAVIAWKECMRLAEFRKIAEELKNSKIPTD